MSNNTLAPSKTASGDLIVNLYAVYDKKVEGFVFPQFHVSDAVAIRSFHVACTTPDMMFNLCPVDFSLVRLGSLNQDTGEIIGSDVIPLVTALECVQKHDSALSEVND